MPEKIVCITKISCYNLPYCEISPGIIDFVFTAGERRMLDQETFADITALLLPHMHDPAARKALVERALFGCKVLDSIDWTGNAQTFTIALIQRLDAFGECAPRRPALVMLLETFRGEVGVNYHVRINVLIARMRDAYPNSGARPSVTLITSAEKTQSTMIIRILRDPAFQAVIGIIGILLTVAALVVALQQANSDDRGTLTPPITALPETERVIETFLPTIPTSTQSPSVVSTETAVPPSATLALVATERPLATIAIPPTPVVLPTSSRTTAVKGYPCEAQVNPNAIATTLNVVRQFPNQTARIVASVQRGASVTVIERSAGAGAFYHVQVSGQTIGWIDAEHLVLLTCP